MNLPAEDVSCFSLFIVIIYLFSLCLAVTTELPCNRFASRKGIKKKKRNCN